MNMENSILISQSPCLTFTVGNSVKRFKHLSSICPAGTSYVRITDKKEICRQDKNMDVGLEFQPLLSFTGTKKMFTFNRLNVQMTLIVWEDICRCIFERVTSFILCSRHRPNNSSKR